MVTYEEYQAAISKVVEMENNAVRKLRENPDYVAARDVMKGYTKGIIDKE